MPLRVLHAAWYQQNRVSLCHPKVVNLDQTLFDSLSSRIKRQHPNAMIIEL
jgi:hypothetical protein